MIFRDYCKRIERDTDVLVSLDHEMQQFGYESTLAFSQALQEYTKAHEWAIHNLIRAHVLFRSGPSMAIARQEPRTEVLRIHLVCQTTPGTPRSQRNPATTFRVADHGFWPIAYYSTGPARNARVCADMLRASRKCHEDNLKSPTLNSHYYVGVLPVMYVINGVSLQPMDMFPVFRPLHNINMDASVKVMLRDLIRYCAYTMNTAFPLRSDTIDDSNAYYAVPGRYTRSKGKQWLWEALFHDWVDYHTGHCERLPGLEELGLALPPAALMNLYTTFWAMDTASIGVWFDNQARSGLLTMSGHQRDLEDRWIIARSADCHGALVY